MPTNRPHGLLEIARRNKRWGICLLLMLATTVSYLDRQTLSVAAITICKELNLTDADYGDITSSFLLAYAVMHPIAGRIIDWLGTRTGFALAVIWWSIANISHAFAVGFRSLATMRFMLGVGEAGNFPGAIKTVSEWFPAKERALATGVLNVGAGLGAMIAPPAVGVIIIYFGWQAAFVATGSIGFLWVILWLLFYYPPDKHPRITPEELALIREGQVTEPQTLDKPRGAWREVLSRRDLWIVMSARFLSDPGWIFYVVWLPKYLSDVRGFSLAQVAMSAWVPFLAGDVGSIVGGAMSAYLARLGFQTINARKVAMCICAAMMPVAILAVRAHSPYAALFFVSIATFAHQAWAASILTLPADLFPKHTVGSAYGFTGACGNFGCAVFTVIAGRIITNYGYFPIFMAVSFLHPLAALITVLCIKSKSREDRA
jgi:ACS family hexuronate transporter-like MFS transporter